MFAAGTDTTHIVLKWAMTELLRHPGVMKQVQNEVRGLAGAGKLEITKNDLEKMHYLRAVIKETLRLHPPIPLLIQREASQDVNDIAAGTMVMINAWVVGRATTTWDQPEEYRPERFLNSSVDFRGHDFQLIPFRAGRRGCPGISFAMAANELLLANLASRFDWVLPARASGDDLDMPWYYHPHKISSSCRCNSIF
ncbi:hypothetical protein OIU77_000445 [Salix suchowensis]|uniref:Uncharacterized protein n=1 Tax=Salix suchowensis TaxID=1278906 RepID=A0ABQ9B8G3_9ROSI|nr:hypothetical protein OIU77_000445 [Salix suchowensis]